MAIDYASAKKIIDKLVTGTGASLYDQDDGFTSWICDDEEHQWVLDYEMSGTGELALSYCDDSAPIDVLELDEFETEEELRYEAGNFVDENDGGDWW